jgi:hypothetical protein
MPNRDTKSQRRVTESELDELAKVCHYFREGHTPQEIVKIMKRHGTNLSTKKPYDLIKRAINLKLISVDSPTDNTLSKKIVSTFSLTRVDVTATNDFVDDIAMRAALC